MTKVFAVLIAIIISLPVCTKAADLRLGIVGTDTSHVLEFTALLNDASSPDHVSGARIVAAYKGGSPDFAASRDRIDGFTRELQTKFGIEIVGTIAELCQQVDGVLLESVDGRIHLAQVREIVAARKPVFIDKPLAATLTDAREIARMAKQAGVPWFSTSTLRYAVADLKTPDLSGTEVWGPGPFAEHHPLDLAWYAIHEVEMLYALMGVGCEEVTRISGATADVVACRWSDGRLGTMRGLRPGATYGAVLFRKDGSSQIFEANAPRPAPPPGAEPPMRDVVRLGALSLMRDVVKFFETRVPPVPNDETLEMFAFMDAAQRSKEAGGKPIRLR